MQPKTKEMSHFYKKAGVILETSKPWEITDYGFAPEGKGDCIGRTALIAIARNDKNLLTRCCILLRHKQRWPDELNHANIRGKKKYRKQTSITRDPIVGVIIACFPSSIT